RGDPLVDRAADRQPGGPQAQGGGRRPDRGGGARAGLRRGLTMRVERWTLAAGEAEDLAARARALAAPDADVRGDVARIVDDVRARGDAALDAYVERFDGTGGAP